MSYRTNRERPRATRGFRWGLAWIAAAACASGCGASGGTGATDPAAVAPPAAATTQPAAGAATEPSGGAAPASTTTEPAAGAPAAGAGVITGKLSGKPKHLKGAVVFVSDLAGEPADAQVTLDQKNQEFAPHVLAVPRGTTVVFANSDATGHNVFSPDGEKYDLGTFQKGETRTRRFDKEGVYTQLCHLHPSMLGFVVVVKNRWFAVAGEDGAFRIEGVPAGERTIEAWQEKAKGEPLRVTVVSGKEATVDLPMKKQ